MVHVTFTIHYNTVIGQILRVIGSIDELGNWNEGIEMKYNEGLWTVELEIQTIPFNFKFQLYNDVTKEVVWEDCENRLFVLVGAADDVLIECNWNCPDDTKIILKKSKAKKSTIKKSTSSEFK